MPIFSFHNTDLKRSKTPQTPSNFNKSETLFEFETLLQRLRFYFC